MRVIRNLLQYAFTTIGIFFTMLFLYMLIADPVTLTGYEVILTMALSFISAFYIQWKEVR